MPYAERTFVEAQRLFLKLSFTMVRIAAAGALAAAAAAAGAFARASPVSAMPRPTAHAAAPPAPAATPSHAHPEAAPAMVPITRDFLRAFYKRYADPSFSPGAAAARARLAAAASSLSTPPASPPEQPRRMDECMYAARCACEEGAHALRNLKAKRAVAAARALDAGGARFAAFQRAQRTHVSAMVNDFLPADFRARLFHAARARSEERNQAAVDDLIARGGSIRDKYALLWEQQWARRETLSAVGNATGIWKLAVRFIAGVPQPLLDFARQINLPNGPTEELRAKFGPVLTDLVAFAAELREFTDALTATAPADNNEPALTALADAAVAFQEEVDSFCTLLTQVVEESPFFVTPEQIDALKKTTS